MKRAVEEKRVSYSDKVWLKEYPAGVPHTVDVSAYASVADVVEKSCEKFRRLPAFECMGSTMRYDDVDRLSGCRS